MNFSRVLFFISSLKSGGAENHLLNLLRSLKASGVETAVCTISPVENELDSRILLEGGSLYRVPLRSLGELFNPSRLAAVSRVISSFKPDIVHAHLYHAEVVAALALLFSDVPLIVTRHSFGLEFNGFRCIVARILQRRYSRMVAVSGEIAEEIARMGYPKDKTVVIPNAVNTGRFKPFEKEERERKRRELLSTHFDIESTGEVVIVGAVGGLKEVKNYPLFVRVASSLVGVPHSAGDKEYRFMIIGEGPMRKQLEDLIDEESLAGIFSLPGYTGEIEEILPLLDILVITSRTEGVPLSLLEAMACGVVPISPDVGGVGEVIGDCGIVLKDHSIEGFVDAISRLAADDVMRIGLSARARKRVLERYDESSWAKKIIDLYNEVLSDKPAL